MTAIVKKIATTQKARLAKLVSEENRLEIN